MKISVTFRAKERNQLIVLAQNRDTMHPFDAATVADLYRQATAFGGRGVDLDDFDAKKMQTIAQLTDKYLDARNWSDPMCTLPID